MSIPASEQVIHQQARSLFAGAWEGSRFDAAVTPVLLGSLYMIAAAVIEKDGYSPHVGWARPGSGSPQSLASSVRAAALQLRPVPGEAADLEEEALARLAGVLYLTGQRQHRTLGSGGDIADAAQLWDGEQGKPCPPGAGDCPAVTVLSAAALFMALMAER